MPEHNRFSAPQKESGTSESKQLKKTSSIRGEHPEVIIQRARMQSQSLTPVDVMQLQKSIGNRAIFQLMREIRSEGNRPVQREKIPNGEELPVQGRFAAIQMQEHPEEVEPPLQMKQENRTGMPDHLKAGVESLSGMDMSNVRVHYNSDKPAGLGALAYTQGTDIHVAPGQERYLPHEAWHVVQQAQGRVQPTMQLRGVSVNDDAGLEQEADTMGALAEQSGAALQGKFERGPGGNTLPLAGFGGTAPVQRAGHTDEWNNYTRADTKKVKGQQLAKEVGPAVNSRIQRDIRAAADRYKNVYITFGGNPIVISSPKALFHFSLDITEEGAKGSHFTFETYNAGRWLHTKENSIWQSEEVTGVVSSAEENEQWLLERAGERGMLGRLERALEEYYFDHLYEDLKPEGVDAQIAKVLANLTQMRELNQQKYGGKDVNPIEIYSGVPDKVLTDAHWRAAPSDKVLQDKEQNPENIEVVWGRMKQVIDSRSDLKKELREEIITQTEQILSLGVLIYNRLRTSDWSGEGTSLRDFGESSGNRKENSKVRLNSKENAERLVRNEDLAQVTVKDKNQVRDISWINH